MPNLRSRLPVTRAAAFVLTEAPRSLEISRYRTRQAERCIRAKRYCGVSSFLLEHPRQSRGDHALSTRCALVVPL
ncbi:hypothetical protein CEE69_20955 [Rhodopirellula bahusiensis]|uniref:Uncharacterized protein n=1 Tax=Rhodopirellula bahusiensis TaxID=2014065 RepID=A0A2G1W2J4_9BACT|nr:hypothetical protein CEE69_20955 [Rhodopirellula bahusiensis]